MMSGLRTLCAWVLVAGVFAGPAGAAIELKDSDRVILFGDVSLSQMYGTEWIDQFLRTKYPDLKATVLSFGVRGSDAADGEKRLPIEVLPLEPTQVIFSFGLDAPDLKAFDQQRLDAFLESMKRMIATVREAGATPVIMTPPPPQPSKKRGMQHIDFDTVVARYAEALRALAADQQIEVVDWHAAMTKFNESNQDHPADWTKDAMTPNGLGIAVMTDCLLSFWNAEPIEYLIETTWNTDDVSVTMGRANVKSHDDSGMEIALVDVPMPLDMAERGLFPEQRWPLSKWCKYRLKINGIPEAGVVISAGGKNAKPFLSQQLAEGADMSALGPLANAPEITKLRNAIRTKLNQSTKYRTFIHRKAPEPELEEGYKIYQQAEKSLLIGAHKIAYRTPTRFNVTLKIELATKSGPASSQRRQGAGASKIDPTRGPRGERNRNGN